MTSFDATTDCLLCDELSERQSLSTQLGLYDSPSKKILLESEHFVLLRDISPIVPGHCLLIPKRHHSNFGQLSETERSEFSGFKKDCVAFVSEQFIPPVLFEHGSRDGQISHGACVSHAHIHLIPVLAPAGEWITEAGSAQSHDSVFFSTALAASGDSGYLAFEGQTGPGLLVSDIRKPLPCQFIRRCLASHLKLSNWNWKLALQRHDSHNEPRCASCRDHKQQGEKKLVETRQ